jgi:hypothetical protein
MSQNSTLHGGSRAKVMRIIWLVASVLVLFTAENIWIDPWLRGKSRHVPSLTLEPMSGLWFLALLGVTVFSILLIVAQVLVALDRAIPFRKRVGTGLATISAILLCVLWARVTTGSSALPAFLHRQKSHSVTLTWKPSKSQVNGYNVYRGTKFGGPYARINSDLVQGLSFQDQDVKSGTTYYYVIRAVDANGSESANSSEITAKVP